MYRISVLTATHNRSTMLKRLYSSLMRSTYKDFEWLIMDDGSTDDTREVVQEFIGNGFKIKYFYQDNSGKHVAMNRLYEQVDSEYCFEIDDDDELLPDAMEKGLRVWDNLPVSIKQKTWCVTGRCIDNWQHKLCGKPFPDNINALSKRKQHRVLKSIGHEMCGLMKTSIVKEYKSPEIEGVDFVIDGFRWSQICCDFDRYYTNIIFRVYYVPQKGGENLSNRKEGVKRERAARNDYTLHKYILRNLPDKYTKFLSKNYIYTVGSVCHNARLCGITAKELMEGLKLREKLAVFAARALLCLRK